MGIFSKKEPIEEIKSLIIDLDYKSKQGIEKAKQKTEAKIQKDSKLRGYCDPTDRELIESEYVTQEVKRLIGKYIKLKKLVKKHEDIVKMQLDKDTKKLLASISAAFEIFMASE